MREQSPVPLGLIHFVRFQAEIAGSPACSAGNHGCGDSPGLDAVSAWQQCHMLLAPVRGGELSGAAQGRYLGKIRSWMEWNFFFLLSMVLFKIASNSNIH